MIVSETHNSRCVFLRKIIQIHIKLLMIDRTNENHEMRVILFIKIVGIA